MLRGLFLLQVIHQVIFGRGDDDGFNDGCKRRPGLEQAEEIPTVKQAMDEHSDSCRCAILAESWRQHIAGIN